MHHPGMFGAVFVIMLVCCVAIRTPREIRNKPTRWLIAFSILYFARVNREEAVLQEHLGSAYADYKQQTKRLWPALRR